jgi:hypothetical protein
MQKKSRPWCYIPVNKGHKAKIDTEDYERVMKHTWRVIMKDSGRIKAVTSVQTPKGVRQVSLGQFLMKPPKGKMVYPRRFVEGLDYRKDNLIICTIQERQRMLPKNRRSGSSVYKGVSHVKSKNLWRAEIWLDGKCIHLGEYASEDEAAKAYNDAARKYFKEFAYQNQIHRNTRRRRSDRKKR